MAMALGWFFCLVQVARAFNKPVSLEEIGPVLSSLEKLYDSIRQGKSKIDVVYTWVDGQDEDWIGSYNKALSLQASDHPEEFTNKSGINLNRFRSHDELRFSLRSLNKFGWMNHVRKIHIVVADGQRPAWLKTLNPSNRNHAKKHDASFLDIKGHGETVSEGLHTRPGSDLEVHEGGPLPEIELVPHSTIFPDPDSTLPNFNSQAIESRLHHIPGLGEWFFYFNDDMFVTKRSQHPLSMFVQRLPASTRRGNLNLEKGAGGVQLKVFGTQTNWDAELEKSVASLERDSSVSEMDGDFRGDDSDETATATVTFGMDLERETNGKHHKAMQNTIRALKRLFRDDVQRWRSPEHGPQLLSKAVLLSMEADFPEEFQSLPEHRFRSDSDLVPTYMHWNYVWNMAGLGRDAGRFEAQLPNAVTKINMRADFLKASKQISGAHTAFMCLNDEIPDAEASTGFDTALQLVLKHKFGNRALAYEAEEEGRGQDLEGNKALAYEAEEEGGGRDLEAQKARKDTSKWAAKKQQAKEFEEEVQI